MKRFHQVQQQDLATPSQVEMRSQDKLPGLLSKLAPNGEFHELQAPLDTRSVDLPFYNQTTKYHLVVNEDARFVTFQAEIARLEPRPPAEFHRRIHEIANEVPQAHLQFETGLVQADGAGCDSVFLTKQVRKAGVPSSTILDEAVSFDVGVEVAFPRVRQAALESGAALLPGKTVGLPNTEVLQPQIEGLSEFIKAYGKIER